MRRAFQGRMARSMETEVAALPVHRKRSEGARGSSSCRSGPQVRAQQDLSLVPGLSMRLLRHKDLRDRGRGYGSLEPEGFVEAGPRGVLAMSQDVGFLGRHRKTIE